jgi:NTE family protein
MEILSHQTYPSMPVKTAIRASLSIPLYFGVVFIDSTGKAYSRQSKEHPRDVLLDGGVIANYPLTVFDTNGIPNMKTLGLKLDRPEQIEYNKTTDGIAPYGINSFSTYIAALYNIVLEQLNQATSYTGERSRTIYISTGNVQPRVKKMPKAQKDLLYNNGKKAAEQFLQSQKQ